MHAIKAKLPDVCGYVVITLAVTLLGYTAACAPRSEPQWNSYYYGSAPQMDSGVSYHRGMDADDNYVMPKDMRFPADERNSLLEENALHGNRFR